MTVVVTVRRYAADGTLRTIDLFESRAGAEAEVQEIRDDRLGQWASLAAPGFYGSRVEWQHLESGEYVIIEPWKVRP